MNTPLPFASRSCWSGFTSQLIFPVAKLKARSLVSLLLVWILVCQTTARPYVHSTYNAGLHGIAEAKAHSLRVAQAAVAGFSSGPHASVGPAAGTLTDAIITRHAPVIHSGRIDGTLRVLQGESFSIGGSTSIDGDLFLPGAPSIQLNGGAQHAGLIEEGGAEAPANYTVTLSAINLTGRIHTRVDPVSLPADFPQSVPASTGNRNVTVKTQSEASAISDWQTVRDLNVTRSGLVIRVPPGHYSTFTVNGNSRLEFTAGTYNFANTFNLDGGASLQATGAVTINIGDNLTINSGSVVLGSYTAPADVRLNVLGILVSINGSSQLSGLLRAYNAGFTANGNAQLRGQVISNRVTLNGGRVTGAVWPAAVDGQMVIFGPRRFDRTVGPPNQYLEQFTLPAALTSPFMMHIRNGEASGANRVSSATIKLNGAEVLVASELNQNVAILDRPVTLNANNTLEVRLASDPGSYLVIDLSSPLPFSDTTPPTLMVSFPGNNITTTSEQINFSGTAVDPGTSATGVAHVYVNGLEAILNEADSTWSISDVPLELGLNKITVRAVDGAGNETITVLNITRETPNHPPVVDAGTDQSLTLPQTASLHGSASDDGLPTGSSLQATWSVVSNPGPVTFVDATALETTASFGSPGTYVLRLTVSDGDLSESQDVTITVDPANQPPTVNAGPNQTIALPRTATLNGTVTDDGLPATGTLNILWSQVSGPGTAMFEEPLLSETVASFSAAGTYVLRLTASDGDLVASNDVFITVHPQNQAPTANAGPDQTITLPATAQLNGSASDDVWPFESTLTVKWSMVSGPGSVVFGNPNVTVTSAAFSVPGTYRLRLTASDGELNTTAELSIFVTPPNQAPVVNAGSDQTISLPATAELQGTVSDDGLPLGSSVFAIWSKVGGPGEVTFGDASQPVTVAEFTMPGEYVLRLSAGDSQLLAADEVTIIVVDPRQRPVADFIVPQSTGVAGAFVIASTGAPGSSFAPDLILDNNLFTGWITNGPANQFVTIQFFDQQNVFIDRVRLQANQALASGPTIKDFEVQISLSSSADASFVSVLNATYQNNGQLQEFVLPGGPVRARFLRFLPKNNHAGIGNIQLATFNPVAVGSIDPIISLPGQTNASRSQSPALYPNGGVIHSFSYAGGVNSANGLLGYNSGGWITGGTSNEFAIVQLAGTELHTIKGVKLATWFDFGFGRPTAVKDFEVWVSTTTTDPSAFTRVLQASTPFVAAAQTYLFPGGPVPVRYIKYIPLSNHGGGTAINTLAFDVIPQSGARVVGVSGEYEHGPHPAEAAFDGDSNSIWFGPNSVNTNVWVKTSLTDDQVQKVYGVRIHPVNDFSFQQRGPKDFDVRVSTTTSDNNAFFTIFSGTLAGTFGGGPQEFIFPNLVEAKYVQFFWKNSYSSLPIGVRELEVLAAPTRGSALIAFSSQDEPSANCLDLDPTNQVWSTAAGQTTNQWIKLLLPRAELSTINHIALRPAIAVNGFYGAPRDFEFLVSNTDAADSSFTTVVSGTLSNTTQLQDFMFPPTEARYVKLLLKNNYQFSRIGLAGFYVYAANEIGTTTRFLDQSSDADGPIVSWAWDFGDGQTSDEQTPTHTYAQPGDYTVALTVTDHSGLTHTRQSSYHVYPSIRPDFSSSPVFAHEAGEPARFTDLSKVMLQPTGLRQYSFGNGASMSQYVSPGLYTYPDSGVFNATLQLGDAQGIRHTAVKGLVILNLPPVVQIETGKTVVWGESWTSVPLITDQSAVDRVSLQGQWDFGDGQTSQCTNCTNTSATVTHSYGNPGTYNAVLTVTDKDGGTGSDTATFVVNKRPTAFIFQNPPAQTTGEPLLIHAQLMDIFANQPLVGKSVKFTLNGAGFDAVTGANGVAEVSVPLPSGTKIDIIIGTFAGDQFYLPGNTAGVPVTAGATTPAGASSHQGTNFWLMFPQAFADSSGFAAQSLFITSPVATTGTVNIPGLNFTQNFSVQANSVSTVVLPSAQVFENNVVSNKGIHVTSQQPISVYGLNKRILTSDAYLGLPVTALGLDHFILTYGNTTFAPSTEFGVVATENNTTVTVIPSVTTLNRPAGVPYNISLNQGQTYLLQNTTATSATDLSGSRVSSNKPIGVYAAHSAATIPAEVICCADHLVEQVPPVSVWGKRFVTVPLATRKKGDFFRFIAAEDATEIYLNGNLAYTLNRGQYVERLMTQGTEIIATRPIMLAQYSASVRFDFVTSDPFLVIVPPYSQFLNHYVLTTPATGFAINYANLVVPTASLGSITLDDSPISTTGFAPIGVSGFSGGQIPLSVGAHVFDGPVNFGVVVYGYNQDEAYGYPGGLNLSAPLAGVNVRLQPETSGSTISTQACLVATVTDELQFPLGGRTVDFIVTGANPSTTSSVTDAAGQATLCYVGTSLGTDNIAATLANSQSTASVIWMPPNQSPSVDAGLDQTITLPAVANLTGATTDDGLPMNTLTLTWSVVSGPGNVTFGNPHAASTTAGFDTAGIYVLRLVATDSALDASDDVRITVLPEPDNQPPTAEAGPDQSATLNGNLIANGGNDQSLTAGETDGWTEVQGTDWTRQDASGGNPPPQYGTAYFSTVNSSQAELRQDVDVSAYAAGIGAGTQQFKFKAYIRSLSEPAPDSARVLVEYRDAANANVIAALDSGEITSTTGWHLIEDIRAVPTGTSWIRVRLIATRNSLAPNDASNDAFFDSISLRPVGNAAVKLNGAIADDGLPFGSSLSAEWTAVSGPGIVVFANANSPSSGASFTTPGTYGLRLTATDGQLFVADDVTFTINAANQPPFVSAGTNQTITLPGSVSLNGTVADDAQPARSSVSIAWSQVSGPGVVTFGNAESAATSASFSLAGTYVLSLTADDAEYETSADVTVTVNPIAVNQPPAVNPGPNQTISLPIDTVTLSGTVTDDGLPTGSTLAVTWTMLSGPGMVAFGSPNSAVTTAQFSAAGSYVLRLSASDGAYLVSADLGVTLTPQNQPPTASAGPDQTILLSQTAQLNGSGGDDGLPGGNLTTNWSKVSGPGTVAFINSNVTVTGAQFNQTGTYVLRITATDGALTASDEITITVIEDVAAPTVEITGPADGGDLTEPTQITGSVSNGDWVLEWSLNSEDGAASQVWTEVAAGSGPVTDSSLGMLDTTLMLNGIYSVRLRATDSYGQTAFTSIAVLVDKNLKVGHFQIAFSDLNVPVAGLPIEVVRSYDSRDKRNGDFGVGWQLGISSARVEKTGVLGFGWHQTATSGFTPTYCLEASRPHKVAIAFGDGKVFKFRASTAIHCQQLAPISSTLLTFTPEPGTHATLESTSPTDVIVAVQGSIPGPVHLISQTSPAIYNTGTFRLTTAEGMVYVIDQLTGVQSVRDPYGNTLTINSAGIVHSSGQSIAFTRDGAGRITQITDPAGNPQNYVYDANGDLASYTDRQQQTTTFTYNPNHHVATIIDARGVELLANQYDAGGRLIGQTDASNKTLVYDHNIAGRVETITDRLGHQTRYEYDERGNVLRQVDAKGGVKTFTYDDFDNLLTEANALGHTTTYTYDSADNRTSVTDALGNVTRTTYNFARQPLTITDALGNVTTNTYDAAGTNLLTTTDPSGQTTSFTYSVFTGQRTTMKDALDHVTQYGYDGAGRLHSETDALGHATTYGYDSNGNRTTVTVTRINPAGQTETITTTNTYDKLNRLTKTTFADGSFALVEYNSIGQQAATIDQLGHRTEFTYDEMGRLTRTDYPGSTHEETTYDDEGRRLTSKDRDGRVTSFSYDELGRLSRTTYPDNTFTSTTYDAVGQVLTTADARGNVKTYFYDNAGCRTKVGNALNQETSFAYDAIGNQRLMTDALGHTTTYEYDLNNRRTKTIYDDGSFDTVGYDALGRSVSKTDQAGKITEFTYDALGRLAKVKDALNQETTYGYNELGQQLTQTDANNHTTRFEYDKVGRRVKRILPAGQFETYSYDPSGNLKSRTDFNGKTTTFNYDVMRRLLSKVPDPSLNQPTISFSYNSSGQRASMSDVSGTTTYNYDARNRLASKQTPFGTLSYTYDDGGNLLTTRSSNANGASVDYSYDALNRMRTVKDNRLTAVNGGTTTYNYDTVGNLESYLYPNGVTTTYDYNSLNRLSSMNAVTSASTLSSYAYTLGAAGNRTAVSELSGRTVSYTYDDLYRLTNETIAGDMHGINGTVGYGYDPVGNRLSRTSSGAGVPSQTFAFDANDRLTTDTYDHNGNTTLAGGNGYSYDFENHLTSLITHDSSLITFKYDGDGNRVGKTVGVVTTNYLVDTNNHTGYAQVLEELQAGNVTRQFTYGHDLISQRCVPAVANCSVSFYGYDGHGSVRQLTNATASVTDAYDYDAFGNLVTRTGSTSNDYLYSGEQFDANLGFYYLRARYMDPSAGRFWTMDSYEGGSYDPASLHKYLYARNNPSNLIDPSGNFSLAETLNTSVLIGTISGFGIGLYSGGIEGAFRGAIQGAIMGALVPLTGAGVGSFLLGNAARGVFVVGWGIGLGSTVAPGFSLATATSHEERRGAGISLITSAAFMFFGPKVLQWANTKIISGQKANENFGSLRRGAVEPPWSASNQVTQTTFFSAVKAVRVYTEGSTQPVGYWVMAASEIQGLGAVQIQQKFALPFKPSHIEVVDIPAGTTVRIGVAEANRFGSGGGIQIEIQRPQFPNPPSPAPSYGPGVPFE